tara:strand:- start:26 stop:244 length:219 start_codon:yes stop_codon:yes gene_type:complete
MAYCDSCGNYDDEHTDGMPEYQTGQDYQPELYYYWQYPLEEDYLMPNGYECMCEICFDIAKEEGKIKKNCAS